jgi:carboxyl-terminal processing protease
MRKNTKSAARLPLLIMLGVAGGILLGAAIANPDATTNPFGNLLKFREIVSYIDRYYVDEVDTDELVDEAINGMLKNLDPHSVYITKDDLPLAKSQLEGEFEGIGIEFNLIRDSLVVVSALVGGPSEQAGLQPNDRIISVDGENIASGELSNRKVFELLRGPKGSKVDLGIFRRGNEPFTIEVTRDKIPQNSVAASYMVNDEVGYIKVTRFSANTYDEFKDALDKLVDNGMQKLILDLQDNPGGYMDRAINMADEFISGNKMIVYTDGKRDRYDSKSYAKRKGAFEESPVIVLINEGSASASEIVAGALQDNDRALIVGRRSFGKGLVQMPINLSDGSELRLTISRYYTPSGRSIQKPYTEGEDGYRNDLSARYEHGEYFVSDSIKFIDSLRYETRTGRTVYGGGGIMPDVFVPLDTVGNSKYLTKLFTNNIIREYTLNYAQANRQELEGKGLDSFLKNFTVSDKMLKEVVDLGTAQNVGHDPLGYARSKELLRIHTKAMIARSVWGNRGYYPVFNQTNEMFQQALQHFDEAQKLASLD